VKILEHAWYVFFFSVGGSFRQITSYVSFCLPILQALISFAAWKVYGFVAVVQLPVDACCKSAFLRNIEQSMAIDFISYSFTFK
jgi:hypothetical protein